MALLTTLALAGCNPGPAEKTVLQNEAAQAATASTMQGWDRVFGVPDETVRRANQFGFRATPYAADGATFLSVGVPITLSQSAAKSPNTGTFEAAGPTAAAIERIVFTLTLSDPANADTAKQRFGDVIRQFLSQYEIADDKALAGIASETGGDILVAGSPATIAVGKGDPRTITVTFTRSATTTPDIQPAPQIQPDQGQADGNRA